MNVFWRFLFFSLSLPLMGLLGIVLFMFYFCSSVFILKIFGIKPTHLKYSNPLTFKEKQNFPDFLSKMENLYKDKKWIKIYVVLSLIGGITYLSYLAGDFFVEIMPQNSWILNRFFIEIDEDGYRNLSFIFWTVFCLGLVIFYYLMDWLFSNLVFEMFGEDMRNQIEKEDRN